MLLRWTTRCSWLVLAVSVAVVGLSCSGPEDDGVSGVSALPDSAGGESATEFSTSGKKSKVLICHKGQDKRVPPSAVAGHMRHGDTEGSCSEPDVATCPCYLSTDLAHTIGTCVGGADVLTCSTDPADAFLYLSCPNGSPGLLGVYTASSSTGFACTRDFDVAPPVTATGITEAEYQACLAVIADCGQ